MSAQIFKHNVPNNIVFNLFEKICIKTETYYLMNNDSFKKGIYNNYIQEFINLCKPYYHLSKQKYIDKPLTYNSFITILRQICKYNLIKYESKIKYDKSDYNIIYFFYVHP